MNQAGETNREIEQVDPETLDLQIGFASRSRGTMAWGVAREIERAIGKETGWVFDERHCGTRGLQAGH
jgi:hypothetical protein